MLPLLKILTSAYIYVIVCTTTYFLYIKRCLKGCRVCSHGQLSDVVEKRRTVLLYMNFDAADTLCAENVYLSNKA